MKRVTYKNLKKLTIANKFEYGEQKVLAHFYVDWLHNPIEVKPSLFKRMIIAYYNYTDSTPPKDTKIKSKKP